MDRYILFCDSHNNTHNYLQILSAAVVGWFVTQIGFLVEEEEV